MNARVVGLHLHERHGEHPRAVDEVVGRVGGGIEGDSHAHRAKRAVVIVDRSVHEALGLQPGDLREQITIEGLPGVTTLPPGTELRIGALTLRVNGEARRARTSARCSASTMSWRSRHPWPAGVVRSAP